jgi:hypothetical protein
LPAAWQQRRWASPIGLHPTKPLWELWLLPGLAEGRLALFLRMHHAIANGVAGVAAFGALLEVAPDAVTQPVPPWTRGKPAPSAADPPRPVPVTAPANCGNHP